MVLQESVELVPRRNVQQGSELKTGDSVHPVRIDSEGLQCGPGQILALSQRAAEQGRPGCPRKSSPCQYRASACRSIPTPNVRKSFGASMLDMEASRSYIPRMRAVWLKALGNKLSEYIRLAGGGETVLVTDRDRIVAEIVPPGHGRGEWLGGAVLADAVRNGWVTPPTLPQQGAPPKSPVATVDVLLRELRTTAAGDLSRHVGGPRAPSCRRSAPAAGVLDINPSTRADSSSPSS